METKRAQIVVLQLEGYLECQIRVRIGCSKNAEHNALGKFKKYSSYCDKHQPGRPRKSEKDGDII